MNISSLIKTETVKKICIKAQVYNDSEKTGVEQQKILRGYLSGLNLRCHLCVRKQETIFKVKSEFAEACSYTVAIPKTVKLERN